MIKSIKVAFNADETAVNMMKSFAMRNATDFTISVQCVLNDYFSLHITTLAHQHIMYFAVYSQYEHKMKSVDVDNEDLHRSLNLLELRLQHALHKNPPTINEELAGIWNKYLSTNPTFDEYTL